MLPDMDSPRSRPSGVPQRPRHQVKRSLTEGLSSPIRLPRHHHHHDKARRHFGRDIDFDDDNLQPPRNSLHLPLYDSSNPLSSHDNSRRTSLLSSGTEDLLPIPPASRGPPQPPAATATVTASPPRPSKQQIIARERDLATNTTVTLKESMMNLTSYSDATSKHLDSTYYAVLERVSGLRGTAAALRELALIAQDELSSSSCSSTAAAASASASGEVTTTGFKDDARAAAQSTRQQLETLGRFEQQETQIAALQERIMEGRYKVRDLSTRVDTVRGRVEGWERADMDWRDRTRARLKWLWVMMLVLGCVLLVGLSAGQYYGEDIGDLASGAGLRPSSWTGLDGSKAPALNMTEEVMRELRIRKGSRAGGTDSSSTSGGTSASVGEDVLRVFDEL